MITIGQVVYSKCGHDKGNVFIVSSVCEEYVYLVDGKLRTLAKPKKKKIKHVQINLDTIETIKSKLTNNLYILDSDIRKALLPYTNVHK